MKFVQGTPITIDRKNKAARTASVPLTYLFRLYGNKIASVGRSEHDMFSMEKIITGSKGLNFAYLTKDMVTDSIVEDIGERYLIYGALN